MITDSYVLQFFLSKHEVYGELSCGRLSYDRYLASDVD